MMGITGKSARSKSRKEPAATVKANATSARKRNPRASYESGRETRDAIVRGASATLIQHGHAAFTLKLVADAVGISVGNLNYHFRTKISLLETLIDSILEDYLKRFESVIRNDGKPRPDRFGDFLEWVMNDSASREYTHLFRELWAMALHSKPIARALDRFYDRTIDLAIDRIGLSKAAMTKRKEIMGIVNLICVISEGSSILFGYRSDSAARFAEVKRAARQAIELLAGQGISSRS